MSELFAWVFFRLFFCNDICQIGLSKYVSNTHTHTRTYNIRNIYIWRVVGPDSFHKMRQEHLFQYNINVSVHPFIQAYTMYIFIFCQHNFHDIDLYIHTFMSQNKCLSKRGGKCPWWLVLQVLSELKVVCGISGRPWAKGKTNPNTGIFVVRKYGFSLKSQCWDLYVVFVEVNQCNYNSFCGLDHLLFVQLLKAGNSIRAKSWKMRLLHAAHNDAYIHGIHAIFIILCAQRICLQPPSAISH